MEKYIPPETVDPKMPDPPIHRLPSGSCDTHCHVFGPYNRFPFVTPSSYPPPLAPFERYKQMLETTGLQRGILVQPAPYGTDLSVVIDAIYQGKDRIKGIGVTTSAISGDELETLYRQGIVGLRFNEMADPATGRPYKGSVGIEHFPDLAPKMNELGMHAQIWGDIATCVKLAKQLGHLDIPLVFEHMTCLDIQKGTGDSLFQELLAILKEGNIWVKLDLCRVSKDFPDYTDARPFHDALIAANPDRLLWASDWPHVRLGDRTPDVGYLLNLFYDWVGDETIIRKILAANPEKLYGFSPTQAIE